MASYQKVKASDDGWSDWIQPVATNYKLACCDCGLVHTLDFRIKRKRIQFRASRNNRATAQVRRGMKRRAKKAEDEPTT